jgi:hypothetical protein
MEMPEGFYEWKRAEAKEAAERRKISEIKEVMTADQKRAWWKVVEAAEAAEGEEDASKNH